MALSNSGQSPQPFLYDYAPGAAANFWAGNAIELTGGTSDGNLARVSGGNQSIIYAPSLSLNAGAGGIQIDTSFILAPSSEGSLQIITRDGGNLSGLVAPGSTALAGITMSDSGSSDYTTFGTGHAATPLHLNDPSLNPDPVVLDISGDINSFELNVPTFAQINVVGDTYNFGFVGRNLHSGDATCINVGQTAKANMVAVGLLDPATDAGLRVGGAITYRGDLTTETLIVTDGQGNPDPISLALFGSVISGDPALSGKLQYDASTGVLTYVGVLSATDGKPSCLTLRMQTEIQSRSMPINWPIGPRRLKHSIPPARPLRSATKVWCCLVQGTSISTPKLSISGFPAASLC